MMMASQIGGLNSSWKLSMIFALGSRVGYYEEASGATLGFIANFRFCLPSLHHSRWFPSPALTLPSKTCEKDKNAPRLNLEMTKMPLLIWRLKAQWR